MFQQLLSTTEIYRNRIGASTHAMAETITFIKQNICRLEKTKPKFNFPVCFFNFCFFSAQKEIPSGSKQGAHSISEKKVSLRAVRQFMRIGRGKRQTSRRDSSTEDENR